MTEKMCKMTAISRQRLVLHLFESERKIQDCANEEKEKKRKGKGTGP